MTSRTEEEWENIIRAKPKHERKKIAESIKYLMSIPEIKESYQLTGIGVIGIIARWWSE